VFLSRAIARQRTPSAPIPFASKPIFWIYCLSDKDSPNASAPLNPILLFERPIILISCLFQSAFEIAIPPSEVIPLEYK